MRKQLAHLFLLSCLALGAFAQDGAAIKPTTLVFHVFNTDFKTAQQLRTTSFGSTKWSSLTDMQTGFGINYLKGITPKIDMVTSMDGSFTDYLYKDGTSNGSSELLLDVNAGVNLKLFTDKHPVVPYIFGGLGGSLYKGKLGSYIPVGVGLQFNLFDEAFVFSNMQYRKAITSTVNDNLQYSIGIGVSLSKKKKEKPAEPVAVLAPIMKSAEPIAEVKAQVKNITVSVTDELSGLSLPNVAITIMGANGVLTGTTDAGGKVIFAGVPAADYAITGMLHGINTSTKQLAKNTFDIQGIGIPINISHNDPRFTLAGKVTNKTTNKPETDVIVNVDNLTQNSTTNVTNVATDGSFNIQLAAGSDFTVSGKKGGYISNIEKATTKGLVRTTTLYVNLELAIEQVLPDKTIKLSNIYYDSGSTKIRTSASADLEKLIKFLADNPELKIEISSHTDSRGSKALNLKLSKARAQAVVDYLQKNGIQKGRITPKGYGATKVINGCTVGVKCTPAQHEQNRRTEFKTIGSAGL
jgi:outer membrane protein OmpA-like peptidoglycan-associated protein